MPISQAIRFARWLRETRIAAHLTQEQVAEYLDLAQPTYSEWEQKGRQWMEPEQVKRLAAILRRPGAEVTAAMGYPVGGEAISSPPARPPTDHPPRDPVGLMDQIVALTQELHDLMTREKADGREHPGNNEKPA